VILARVRHFLQAGVVLEETCFPASVVSFASLPAKLSENDQLFYGQYDKTSRSMLRPESAPLHRSEGRPPHNSYKEASQLRVGDCPEMIRFRILSALEAFSVRTFSSSKLRLLTRLYQTKKPTPDWAWCALPTCASTPPHIP
jgi:hypothetical protein